MLRKGCDNQLTQQLLDIVISDPLESWDFESIEHGMDYVRLGADPFATVDGNSFYDVVLDYQTYTGIGHEKISAYLLELQAFKRTPSHTSKRLTGHLLGIVSSDPWENLDISSIHTGMKLVRLGANPFVKLENGISFYDVVLDFQAYTGIGQNTLQKYFRELYALALKMDDPSKTNKKSKNYTCKLWSAAVESKPESSKKGAARLTNCSPS